MSNKRLATFEGDVFDLSAIVAATTEGDTVYIYTLDHHEFEYEFKDKSTAQGKHSALVTDWRRYLEGDQAPERGQG